MAALDATAVSVAELLTACTAGDAARVRDLLDQGAPASAQEEVVTDVRAAGRLRLDAHVVERLLLVGVQVAVGLESVAIP